MLEKPLRAKSTTNLFYCVEELLQLTAERFTAANVYKSQAQLSPEITASLKYYYKVAGEGQHAASVFLDEPFKNFSGDFTPKAAFDTRVNVNKCPSLDMFKCVSDDEILRLAGDPASQNKTQIEVSWEVSKLSRCLERISRFYEQMPFEVKEAAYMYLTGFEDDFKESDFQDLCGTLGDPVSNYKQEVTPVSSGVKHYIKQEIKKKRMLKIPKDLATKLSFIASRIIEIKEDKVDADGVPYTKSRFVYNNLAQNSICKFGDENFKFTTVGVEDLFIYNELYEKMLASTTASSYDKKEFYRQWRMSFRSLKLSVIWLSNGEHYYDLSGRMGHCSSSIYATMLSNLVDFIFNRGSALSQGKAWSITNQDDSLLLEVDEGTHQEFVSLNVDLGLELNHKKSQINRPTVVWCGSEINFKAKSIKIREKRRIKIMLGLADLETKPEVQRREVCAFLGCIFSARSVLAAQGFFTSPLCFFTRRCTYLYQEYYSEKLLADKKYKQFYDEKIRLSKEAKTELALAASLACNEVSFKDVRTGMGKIKNLGKDLTCEHMNVVAFSDASDKGYGYGIVIMENETFYEFRGSFEQQQKDWPINSKEFYAAILAMVSSVVIFRDLWFSGDRNRTTNFKCRVVIMVDNECCRAIYAGKRVSCRNEVIGKLAKVMQFIEAALNNEFEFLVKRIPTSNNSWADRLSRERSPGSNCLVPNPLTWLIGDCFPKSCQGLLESRRSGEMTSEPITNSELKSQTTTCR